MGIVFRQSVKNLMVVVSGAILGILLIWLSTKYNSQQQFGLIGTLTTYAVLASQILLFGLNNTLNVFIHRYSNDGPKNRLLITICFILPALIALILIVPYYFLKGWGLHFYQPIDIPFMRHYYMWLPFYTILWIYMVVLEQYLWSQFKVAVAAFMREVVIRVLNIALLVLFGFGYISFNALVIGTILIYILPVSIFFLLSVATKNFGFSFRFNDFSKAEYKELVHFSWYHFLLTVSIIMMSSMDMVMLPFYDKKGFSSVAVYRVAVVLISFLQLPLKALIPASFAILAKAFADGDTVKAKDIFIRSSINILIPTIGIAILICCNLNNAVAMIKNGYGEIIPVFLILFVGTLVSIVCGMNDQVLSITNYYKFNFYMSIVIMVILFFMLRTLIPRYGIYGAAFSTSVAGITFSFLKSIFVWKKLGMKPFTNKTVLVFIAALPALAAGYFLPYFFEPARHVYIHSFIDATMRSAVIVVVYVGMLLWLKPSNDLEEYISSIRKNKRLF